MPLIIEMVCQECSSESCQDHTEKTTKTDLVTGIEFEIRCVCTYCSNRENNGAN